MTQTQPGRVFYSVSEVKRANDRAGYHWFEPGTMRFFNSRCGDRIINGCYFITSEIPWGRGAREYTIRMAKANGQIETIGEMGQYASNASAARAAEKLPPAPEANGYTEQDN